MPDNVPNNPPPNNPDPSLSGRTGILSRIGALIREGGAVVAALPTLMVLRGGVLQPVGAAAKPEATQTPSAVVEYLQQLLKSVLVATEAWRAPELVRYFLSALLLRMRVGENEGKGLDTIGNAHLLEPAVMALVQAYEEEPRARSLLPETTPELLKDLAELRFREEVLRELLGPSAALEGGVNVVQHRLNTFLRANLPHLQALAAQSPRLSEVLKPAQSFVSGPALKGQETRKVKGQAFEDGRAQGRAEAEAAALKRTPAGGPAATVLTVNTPAAGPTPAPSVEPTAAPLDPSAQARKHPR